MQKNIHYPIAAKPVSLKHKNKPELAVYDRYQIDTDTIHLSSRKLWDILRIATLKACELDQSKVIPS